MAFCVGKLFSSVPIAFVCRHLFATTSCTYVTIWLTISAEMKISEQCGIAAAKGNYFLGINWARYSVQCKRINNTAV